MEAPAPFDGTQAAVLVEIGKMSASVAVIEERTKQLPELMTRVREVELQLPDELDARLRGVESAQAQVSGNRDTWARIASGVAVLAAAAASVAGYLHH